jgi:hypothetical protein
VARFAVLTPVGPSPIEMERLSNLLESLFSHEPSTSWVVLIDDSCIGRRLDKVFRFPSSCQPIILPNPRRGRGNGWSGGMCVGVLSGLHWIRKNTDINFILKLDTDALVIAPFGEKIGNFFRKFPDVGIVGSYQTYPTGLVRRNTEWTPSIKTFLSPVKLRGKYLQVTMWGRPRRRREALQRALANGYKLAEHCQGGSYAVNSELLNKMEALGYFDDPLVWLRSGVGEDVIMGIFARATGMQMSDFNRDNEPFGVQFSGLAYSPHEFLTKGYSIIHSIKDDKNFSENEIVNFFRALK